MVRRSAGKVLNVAATASQATRAFARSRSPPAQNTALSIRRERAKVSENHGPDGSRKFATITGRARKDRLAANCQVSSA